MANRYNPRNGQILTNEGDIFNEADWGDFQRKNSSTWQLRNGRLFEASARFVLTSDTTHTLVIEPADGYRVLTYSQVISTSAGPLLTRRRRNVSFTSGDVTDRSVRCLRDEAEQSPNTVWHTDATGVTNGDSSWSMTGGAGSVGNRPVGGVAPGEPGIILVNPYAIEVSSADIAGVSATTNSDAVVTVNVVFEEELIE
jgi:hypothetical protein